MENISIKKAFEFLIKEYLCEYHYNNDYGDHYLYENSQIKVLIYEWTQFGETSINVIIDNENYSIDPYLEEPLEYSELKKKTRGIKGLFYDYNKYFWELAARIVDRKIKELL